MLEGLRTAIQTAASLSSVIWSDFILMMKSTESVSKGCFAFIPKSTSNKSNKAHPNPLKEVMSEEWYRGYRKVWDEIERKLGALEDGVMLALLNDLVSFILESPADSSQIPTVTLLTGVNLPDHGSLFQKLCEHLRSLVTPHVALLASSDCPTLSHTVQQTVSQFMKGGAELKKEENNDESDSETTDICLKRSDRTMPMLAEWYKGLTYDEPRMKKKKPKADGGLDKLVIVVQDFEGFKPQVLHDFILILSGYLSRLPIILVLGVATTEGAIGDYLTHKVTSRLRLKVFQSQPSVYFLNNTVDKVFLNAECPFQLSGKLLKFFTDVFLFHDFSVNRFTQGVKYCVMNHFYEHPLVGLLLGEDAGTLEKNIRHLDRRLMDELRNLDSFKKYLESCDEVRRTSLLNDDEETKDEILKLMLSLRKSINEFYVSLKVLRSLVKDLPQAPLGKQLRELYCVAMCKNITTTPEYKECYQLIKFMSKDELEKKITQVLTILENTSFQTEMKKLEGIKEELRNIGLNPITESPVKSPRKLNLNVKNRAQLKQKVAELGLKRKTGFEELRDRLVTYLLGEGGLVAPHLVSPASPERTVLWELIWVRDLGAKNRVVPRFRAALHTALNDPHTYLQCGCCELKGNGDILPTMPDVCIAYKLHLESGSLINLYDWLKSFAVIVDSQNSMTSSEEIDEKIQARFTQALAELELLGFVKSSKKKPDHVARLTWEGST